MPTTRPGSAAALAIAVIGIDEVLEASTRVRARSALSGREQLALELQALGRRLDDQPGVCQAVELGDGGDLAGLALQAALAPASARGRSAIWSRPRSRASATGSCSSVRAPAAAASCAIPAPMVPAPTTPMTSGISLTRQEAN